MRTSTARTNTDSNLRRWPEIPEAPNQKSNVVTVIRKGQAVTVYDEISITDSKRTWRYIVSSNGQLNGWMAGELLTAATTPPAPQPQPQPVPTPSKSTVVGIHSFSTVPNNTPLVALAELHKAGRPMNGFVHVKLGWQSDFTIADIKRASPSTKVMYRVFRHHEPGFDWTKVGRMNGQLYADQYYAECDSPDLRAAEYDQIICEPGGGICPPVQVANFWHGAMDVAHSKGRKLGILCYAERNPPLPGINANQPHSDFWLHPATVEMLRRAKREGHVLLLHQYVIDPIQRQAVCQSWEKTDWQQDKLYRHQLIYNLLPSDLRTLPLWIAELGDIRTPKCGGEHLKQNIRRFIAATTGDAYLFSANLWTWGSGGSAEWMQDDLGGLTGAYVDAVLGR